MSDEIDSMVGELERTAAMLRAGEVDGDEAAAAVERCAELASAIVLDLERQSREAQSADDEIPDQERLL